MDCHLASFRMDTMKQQICRDSKWRIRKANQNNIKCVGSGEIEKQGDVSFPSVCCKYDWLINK